MQPDSETNEKVYLDPKAGEDLPFEVIVRPAGEEDEGEWDGAGGSTKNPPDTLTMWGFRTEVVTEVRGLDKVVSQLLYAVEGDKRILLNTSWQKLGEIYEVKAEAKPVVHKAPWLKGIPEWKTRQPWRFLCGIKSCGTCSSFDRKTGKDELTKVTHTFDGFAGASNDGTSGGGAMCEAMLTDIAGMLAQQYGTRSLDPERVGFCAKRAALLEDGMVACKNWSRG